jgi:predicted rRNA methylase YqxC with S4 and FtsJ domains
MKLVKLLAEQGFTASLSESRRAVVMGVVKVDGEQVTDLDTTVDLSAPKLVAVCKKEKLVK